MKYVFFALALFALGFALPGLPWLIQLITAVVVLLVATLVVWYLVETDESQEFTI